MTQLQRTMLFYPIFATTLSVLQKGKVKEKIELENEWILKIDIMTGLKARDSIYFFVSVVHYCCYFIVVYYIVFINTQKCQDINDNIHENRL